MKKLSVVLMIVLFSLIVNATELVFDEDKIVISIDLVNSSGLWEEDGTSITPQDNSLELKIPALANCDTIDTDGDGLFSCGSDATGIGEDATVFKNANWTALFELRLGELWNLANYSKAYSAQGWDAENTSSYLITNKYLSTYNASAIAELMGNDTINRSINLSLYNYSIDLSGYISDASIYQKIADIFTFTNLSYYFPSGWNDTINRSVSLDDYNQSIDLSGYVETTDGYDTSPSDDFNYANNLTKYFPSGWNDTINRSINLSAYNYSIDLSGYAETSDLSVYQVEASAWKAENSSIVYYNANQSATIVGTIQGTLNNTQHLDGNYDNILLNFTEESGTPGLDIRVNFTNITSFSQGVMRYKTTALLGDAPIIQLWNYETSDWEDYPYMAETLTYSIIEQSVFDDDDHIQNGKVQMRIYKDAIGHTANKYSVDWIAIAKGYGVPTGNEIDPLSVHSSDVNRTEFNYDGVTFTLNKTWIYVVYLKIEDAFNYANNLTKYFPSGWNDTINRSVSLDDYNQSIDLSGYVETTDGYDTSPSDDFNYANNLTKYFPSGWNDTINRSINLSEYAKSTDLSVFQLITNAFKNINWTTLFNLQFPSGWNVTIIRQTNTSWAITAVNDSINTYYNQSIDLSLYNQSISLDNYNQSVDLSPYNHSLYALSQFENDISVIGDTSNATKMNNTNTGFLNISNHLYVQGNISIGVPADNKNYIYFNTKGYISEYIKFDEGTDLFEFSDDIYTGEDVIVGDNLNVRTGGFWLGSNAESKSNFSIEHSGHTKIRANLSVNSVNATELSIDAGNKICYNKNCSVYSCLNQSNGVFMMVNEDSTQVCS